MSTLTQAEAREAACRLAFLRLDIEKWLAGCSREERQRRFGFVVAWLTPDLCAFCGQAEAQHDAVAQGLLCRRNHGGNGETYTTLRQHHEQL